MSSTIGNLTDGGVVQDADDIPAERAGANVRLNLKSMAQQHANNVNITGGNIAGTANISLANGKLLVGCSNGVACAVSVSGDATLVGNGNVQLVTSGVAAGNYGNATTVPQFTVDAKGRVTAASNVAISVSDPSGFTVIVASANEDVTNAQNTDHSQFQFACTAGHLYLVTMDLAASGNDTTGDYEFRLAVAAGSMTGIGVFTGITAAIGSSVALISASAAANTGNLPVGVNGTITVPTAGSVSFSFSVSNTTTVKFQFGNNAASAGRTSRTCAGSVFRYKDIT